MYSRSPQVRSLNISPIHGTFLTITIKMSTNPCQCRKNLKSIVEMMHLASSQN
ncbi:hypothetical protein [Aerosakkonema funiforme]|uniref:hypothetical protein n=1 Tax=Aerosakkonema funiforme TaxID=1246630 RepID=UPI001686A415|nr:hypothetical protein [Aerosakkonema funiforme]